MILRQTPLRAAHAPSTHPLSLRCRPASFFSAFQIPKAPPAAASKPALPTTAVPAANQTMQGRLQNKKQIVQALLLNIIFTESSCGFILEAATSALQTPMTEPAAAVTQQLQSSASLDGSASSTASAAFEPMKSEPSLCEFLLFSRHFNMFMNSGSIQMIRLFVFVFVVPDFPKELSDMFDPTKGKLSVVSYMSVKK